MEHGGKAIVYATDTEHYEGRVDDNLVALARDADALHLRLAVHARGVRSKKGWGHSTFEEGAKIAKLAGVQKLVLFHHDPTQNDAAVHEKEKRARPFSPTSSPPTRGSTLEV